MILTPIPTTVYPALPATPTHAEVTVNNSTNTTLLAANTSRKKGTIHNNTAASIWVKEGVTAVINEGFEVRPGDIYSAQTTAAINGIQNSGSPITVKTFEAT